MRFLNLLPLLSFCFTATCNTIRTPNLGSNPQYTKTCVVKSYGNGTNDAPAVLHAFQECGHDGHIIFQNQTYYINSVMNTTNLQNVLIDVYGTLLWSKNITYWLTNSLPFGYQNQSSAWWIGGSKIHLRGHGVGTLDGNGQTWYNFVAGVSNYPGRPHAVTFWKMRDSVVEGMRFVQSQMWTMTVFKSENVYLDNIYVNSTTSTHSPARNTDGVDTIYSNNIHFNRCTVINGDDSISMKANSTNILITNCTFYNGLGIALGSIGQYEGVFERIENITVRDCRFVNTLHAGYVKTWTGQQVGYPPNGGGGGLGYARNISFSNFTVTTLRSQPFSITQCTTFSGVAGDCNTSLFEISDINISNITGTIDGTAVASFQCSADAPCYDISMTGLDLRNATTGVEAVAYKCSNVEETVGWNCTGGV